MTGIKFLHRAINENRKLYFCFINQCTKQSRSKHLSLAHRKIPFVNLSIIDIIQVYIYILTVTIYINNNSIYKICLMQKFLQLIFELLG